MIDHDTVAFEVEGLREDHGAAVDGVHRRAGRNAEIESLMRALHGTVENTLHAEDVGNLGGDGSAETIHSIRGRR